jgi:trigger factor
MNIIQEQNGLTQVLKIQVAAEDYAPKVESTLKDYRKKAKIDGFRPGTAPMGMVKKMYGKYVLVEEVNKLLSDALNNHITDNKLPVLGEPLPNIEQQKAINWETDTEFEFCFDIALAPEISVELSKKNKFDYYKIVADDAIVNEQIEQFTARYGTQSSVDTIEGTELVRGNFKQLGVENPYTREGASLLLSKVATESELQVFKNATKGDTIEFNPKKAFENDVELSSMLAVDKDKTDILYADYSFEITDILRFTKSPVDQTLFDKVFGEGVVTSEAEFKDKIRADFEMRVAPNSDYKLLLDIKKKLVESIKFDLPEEFLKRWLLETNKNNDKITPEQIESEFPLFLEDLRWQLISGKIIKDNAIQITEEDVRNGAKEYTRMQFAQFGMMNPSDEDLEHWSKEIIKNRDQANRIVEQEQDKKLIAFFKETVKLNEVEKTIEEFNAMFEKK